MIGRQVVLVKERDGLMPGSRGKVLERRGDGFRIEVSDVVWKNHPYCRLPFSWIVRADQVEPVEPTPVERYIMNELHNAP